MPTTHLKRSDRGKEFDHVMSAASYLVHAPGSVTIVTSDGQEHVATSGKPRNRHRINCPYCNKTSWRRVNA